MVFIVLRYGVYVPRQVGAFLSAVPRLSELSLGEHGWHHNPPTSSDGSTKYYPFGKAHATFNYYKSVGCPLMGESISLSAPLLSSPDHNLRRRLFSNHPLFLSMSTPMIGQARAIPSIQDCIALYDKWAATYDNELGEEAQNYVAPVLAAEAAIKFKLLNGPANSVILDAGCGTGLVGHALAVAGAKPIDGFDLSRVSIDGLDLSPAMLAVAKQTGIYRDLAQADLNHRIEKADEAYDMVACVGTFTRGHVGPDPALREFVRVTKRNGIIVATILEEIWVSGGFKAEVERLEAESLVTVVAEELIDYVKGRGDKAVLVILERIA